jgi:hypothetical protein
MKITHISIFAVMLVVAAVAFAGCSTTTTTQQAGSFGTTGSPSATSGSSASSSGAGADSANSLMNYNWVEYKATSGSGESAMTVYTKFARDGKCTFRMEGGAADKLPANLRGGDCSANKGSSGMTSAPNPSGTPTSGLSCSAVEEPVTVPAGIFTATKCTTPTGGTMWMVKNKFMVRLQTTSSAGPYEMVLNGYG